MEMTKNKAGEIHPFHQIHCETLTKTISNITPSFNSFSICLIHMSSHIVIVLVQHSTFVLDLATTFHSYFSKMPNFLQLDARCIGRLSVEESDFAQPASVYPAICSCS